MLSFTTSWKKVLLLNAFFSLTSLLFVANCACIFAPNSIMILLFDYCLLAFVFSLALIFLLLACDPIETADLSVDVLPS